MKTIIGTNNKGRQMIVARLFGFTIEQMRHSLYAIYDKAGRFRGTAESQAQAKDVIRAISGNQ